MTKKKTSRVGLRHKNKNIFLKVRKCTPFDEFFGLMFTKRKSAEALLFDFAGRKGLSLHSFFVFFPFLALWLDDKNNILEFRVVKPFSSGISSKKLFAKIIEIPINGKYRKIIRKLVDKRKI